MGDGVGDQCLFVETEEKDGDLHSSNGVFLERLWGALCFIVVIKNKDLLGLLTFLTFLTFWPFLRLRAPLLFAHDTMINKLESYSVIFQIQNVALLCSCITITCIIVAFNGCDMW